MNEPTQDELDQQQLENARKTLAKFFPGGSLRWTKAQQVEAAIRVIARDEMKTAQT